MKLLIEISKLQHLRTLVFYENPIPNITALRKLLKEDGVASIQAEIIARANGYVSTVDTEDIERNMVEQRFNLADEGTLLTCHAAVCSRSPSGICFEILREGDRRCLGQKSSVNTTR